MFSPRLGLVADKVVADKAVVHCELSEKRPRAEQTSLLLTPRRRSTRNALAISSAARGLTLHQYYNDSLTTLMTRRDTLREGVSREVYQRQPKTREVSRHLGRSVRSLLYC
ncbi:hypothetical protein L227DRAFT_156585 [Lentinus tigrinus ALCF2SS1-6]|uniref:Uncharacterized protein n=1 Tax=Lentinus tigrinus ALCF2SS1-6 TaxID=1328759 RepID=A0A5C2SEG6_9APHY|nr:hypothetical protein L227DRAFT_156585 [Lentinus tigrinus ALCF2SS1-6]